METCSSDTQESSHKESWANGSHWHPQDRRRVAHLSHKEPRKRHFHGDSLCPVCLHAACCPVETNCGHLFCAPCLLAYWRHGPWLGAISCPLCRQKVTSMYSLSGDTRRGAPEVQVLRDIGDYNKRFSGQPRPMSDYLYDMPLFLHLMLRGLFTMAGLIWIFCLRIVVCFFGAVLSLTLSVDVIPEPFCWVLGAVDDLVVVFLVLACMINIHQQMAPDRANVQNSSSSSSTRDVL
ncbi:RING-HC_RNF170 domain-containing protein [Erpetoichthys calabaricus]|uniref:E3 ubiquitin-protein ligase RNF170 n=1 Tax=Erpetoichthys calabaricus TaxID=27687 RepID=A0A8C4T2M4_ERPCA|nr:RING-HC_RNF170 domain-containing protein [Erpetoichthys calabaricus]